MTKLDIADRLTSLGYDFITAMTEASRIIAEAQSWPANTTHTYYERTTGLPIVQITKHPADRAPQERLRKGLDRRR